MKRPFHIGDVLSITTGRLVSNRHIDGVYDILNYMTGDNLFTHQLPGAAKECAPELPRQHPQLAKVDATGPINADNLQEWLSKQAVEFGEQFDVEPLPSGGHEHKDALAELAERVGGTCG